MAFILVLKASDRPSLAAIRLLPKVEVATDATDIWVRLPLSNEGLDPKIRQLPLVSTYFMDEKQHLYPIGGLTPVGVLKPLTWLPLTDFMPIELPVSALPAATSETVVLNIIPSEKERETTAVMTTGAAWLAYVTYAPEARLRRLHFAVSNANAVLVFGTPLPPIDGETYWLRDNIFMPSGFDFALPMVSELIFLKENLENQAFLLFNTEGSYHRLEASDFMPVSRSAVKLTFQTP